MNKRLMTAGETAKEVVAVCDVFEISKTVAGYRERGYEPTGDWCYANGERTLVRMGFATR